jgi:hypothetical protein
MTLNTKSMVERIRLFKAAWNEQAPTESFAGMTYAQFEAACADPLALREEILQLDIQREGKRTEREQADLTARNLCDLVVNSVRGTPGHGKDSALYRALGYVRQSERKSGLTRRSGGAGVVVSAVVDASADGVA